MPTPPELNEEFRSQAERTAAQAELRRLGYHLREVMTAADGAGSVPPWLTDELRKPLRGHVESPGERLARYRNVFADELQALDDALVSADNNQLDDYSLRAARYLARRLLATLLDCPSSEVTHRLPARPG
ncbi:MAG TPA: hypothetical protein VNF47_00325 [Streptosporangiaceae bacterium]|nr:hypothetical protein [Streptosporangiaceae bacterium]